MRAIKNVRDMFVFVLKNMIILNRHHIRSFAPGPPACPFSEVKSTNHHNPLVMLMSYGEGLSLQLLIISRHPKEISVPSELN